MTSISTEDSLVTEQHPGGQQQLRDKPKNMSHMDQTTMNGKDKDKNRSERVQQKPEEKSLQERESTNVKG